MATKDISNMVICRCVANMHEQDIKPGWRFQNVVEQLMRDTGESKKVCEASINRAIKAGLVEWGIHNSIGWLTENGIAYLKAAEVSVHSDLT